MAPINAWIRWPLGGITNGAVGEDPRLGSGSVG